MRKKLPSEDITTTISPISEKIEIRRHIFSGAFHKENISFPPTWNAISASVPVSGAVYNVIYDIDKDDMEAQPLLSFTFGYTTDSAFYTGSDLNAPDKLRIYRLFAKQLLGNSDTKFRMGQREVTEAAFLCVPRHQFKDQIEPHDDLELTIIGSASFSGSVADSYYGYQSGEYYSLVPNLKIEEGFGGKYVGLYNSGSAAYTAGNEGRVEGLAFLDSGIFVLDMVTLSASSDNWDQPWSASVAYEDVLKGNSDSSFDDFLFGLRHRIGRVCFRNISRMRATFLRTVAEKEEFNYSTNHSYTRGDGRILTTEGLGERIPTTYITTVGLLNDQEEVVAIAKLNKPIKKDSESKVVINVRLEY